MTFSNDNLGAWFHVGTVTPDHTWQRTLNGAGLNALFRLSYQTDWNEWIQTTKFKSYGLLQFRYQKDGQFNLAARPTKIYPKAEFELIRIPPPPEFANIPNLVRVPAIKRVTYDRRGHNGLNLANIIQWSVKIEYLLVS